MNNDINQNQTARRQQPSLSDTTEVVCEKCKGTVFHEGVMLRKVSALMTETGKAGYIPIPTFSCASCGFTNDEFVPDELKKKIKLV